MLQEQTRNDPQGVKEFQNFVVCTSVVFVCMACVALMMKSYVLFVFLILYVCFAWVCNLTLPIVLEQSEKDMEIMKMQTNADPEAAPAREKDNLVPPTQAEQ